jgi:hypothetical protein
MNDSLDLWYRPTAMKPPSHSDAQLVTTALALCQPLAIPPLLYVDIVAPQQLCSLANIVPQILATYGPNSYEVSTEATQDGTAVTLLETCSLTSNTEAVCSFSVGVSIGGQRTATASTTTLTHINHYQIPITAGASKLPSTVSCTNSPNAAAPTGITDVYKVLVVPAAILAGALA